MPARPELRSAISSVPQRRSLTMSLVAVTVVALFAALLTSAAAAETRVEITDNGVHPTVSCLAGNGRVDINLVNVSALPARYRIEFGDLSARENTVDVMDWWRTPITGRPDGTHSLIVTRDGAVTHVSEVQVQCDTEAVAMSNSEVEVISACRGASVNRGYVLIQIANSSDSSRPYVIEFGGVRNRSTTAAPWGQSLRAVTGRPNGVHPLIVKSEGVVVYNEDIVVDCPAPDATPGPTPTPPPMPTPVATPSPEVSDSAVVSGGFPGFEPGGPGNGEGQPPEAGTLTAADVDDNLNFAFFSGYLEWAQQSLGGLPSAVLDDRLTINLVDESGQPLSNALVEFYEPEDGRFTATADAGGTARIFPTFSGIADPVTDAVEFEVEHPATGASVIIALDGSEFGADREATFVVPDLTGSLPDALDVVFVIDATGSMGDEMEYLKTEFAAIVQEVESRHTDVDMRFALIVYRDTGDDYVVRSFDFASSQSMLNNLDAQSANGGGDYPEAMEEALAAASDLSWRDDVNVSRVLILNADAPPHDENLQTAIEESKSLAALGVRIYPLAASGVADNAEYLMRVMAATTGGRHMFLTDDSGIGGAHQEPMIPCQVVTKLDNLLVRILDGELSGSRVEPADDDVIRTVGDGGDGVCELQEFTPPGPPETPGPCPEVWPTDETTAVDAIATDAILIDIVLPPVLC